MLAGGERKEDGQCYYLFFFQAEDGIRDLYVTEVQTCALPISSRLWNAWLIARAAFISSNFVLYWAGFATVNVLFLMITVIMGAYTLRHLYLYTQGKESDEDLAHAWWLVPYFAGMWVLSYYSPVEMGGTGTFGIFGGMFAVAVFSLI